MVISFRGITVLDSVADIDVDDSLYPSTTKAHIGMLYFKSNKVMIIYMYVVVEGGK